MFRLTPCARDAAPGHASNGFRHSWSSARLGLALLIALCVEVSPVRAAPPSKQAQVAPEVASAPNAPSQKDDASDAKSAARNGPQLLCVMVAGGAGKPAEACPSQDGANANAFGELVGSGDLFVYARQADWDLAMSQANRASAHLKLYINGLPAGDDADLMGTEPVGKDGVRARFHVGTGKATVPLWTALYRDGGIRSERAVPLRAAVGWDLKRDALAAPSVGQPTLKIASEERFWASISGIVALGLLFLVLLFFTPVFRDGPDISGRHATFSLARLQVGLWLFFIVGAATYIRVVLGDLPAVEPTMVGMLSLSAATAFSSTVVGKTTNPNPTPSVCLLTDIITSPDGTQQLHRVQALLVNVLLLAVAVDAVIQDLAFYKFDGSWLALLGVSGAVQAGMKSAIESPGATLGGCGGAPVAPVKPGRTIGNGF